MVEARTPCQAADLYQSGLCQCLSFQFLNPEDWLTDYGLVIANWGVTRPLVPQPWGPMTWDCWQYRADAPGKYYGFYNQYGPAYAAPNMCMAVWNGPLP